MISAGDVGGNFTIVIRIFLVNLSSHVLARHKPTFRIRLLYLEKKEARTHRPYHSLRVVLSLADSCLHDVASSVQTPGPLFSGIGIPKSAPSELPGRRWTGRGS